MARLSEPVGPADHGIGPEDAAVTLVQYGSYDCPHCRQAMGIVEEVRRTCGAPLRYVYRHFPNETRHSSAHRAAEAAESAGTQGKFWEMHALLLNRQNALDDANLLAYAAELGLDVRKIAADLESGVHAAEVRRQFQSGLDSGVHSTPTFFINGERHDDYWDAETLCDAVQSASRGAATV